MNDPQPISLSFADLWAANGLIPGKTVDAPAFDPEAFKIEMLRKQRMERFKAMCPTEFRKPIDRALIKNVKAWDKADEWTGTHPGVWLWSEETGKGKTRMLWRQFGRMHVEQGKSILKISGQALAEEYFAAHMDGDPRGFYRFLLARDVVMIDDIDKINIADARAPRALREVFDELYAGHKPLLVTANHPIDYFRKALGESCARRMGEVCTEINF